MTLVSSPKILGTLARNNPLRYFVNRSNEKTTVLYCKSTYAYVIPEKSFNSSVHLLSMGKFSRDPTRIVKVDGTVVRKKTVPNVSINLVSDSEMTVVTMEAAQSIAKAKGLNLVKLQSDNSSSRETYKLMKDADLGIENTEKSGSKDIKTYIFSSTILDNDLKVKMKLLLKNLHKQKKLKCIIKTLGYKAKAEAVFQKIKEELKKSEIPFNLVPVSSKNNVIHFKIEPDLVEINKENPANRDHKN